MLFNGENVFSCGLYSPVLRKDYFQLMLNFFPISIQTLHEYCKKQFSISFSLIFHKM
jgi:hypothetical protein